MKTLSACTGLDAKTTYKEADYKELVVVFKIRCLACARFFDVGWIDGVETRTCPACKARINFVVCVEDNHLIVKGVVIEEGKSHDKK